RNVLVVPVVALRTGQVVTIDERRGIQPSLTPEEVMEAKNIALSDPATGSVVRLNRRVVYVVGGVLVAVVVTGLIALRAQGSRENTSATSRATDVRATGERWFDKVPDREPAPRVPVLDPLTPTATAPAAPARPPAPAPKAPTPEELEAQRRLRA